MRIMKIAMLTTIIASVGNDEATAQVNDFGTLHVSVGAALGVHGTNYTQTYDFLGTLISESEKDGAITVTYPIDIQFGLTRILSAGLFIEPGNYLDSSATRSNGVFLIGLQPRLYLVNTDHFAFTADGQFGASFLKIRDTENSVITNARYSGPQFGLGLGIEAYFGETFGLHFRTRYVGTSFKLRSFSIDDNNIGLENFEAELKTSGVQIQAGISLKF